MTIKSEVVKNCRVPWVDQFSHEKKTIKVLKNVIQLSKVQQ